MSRAAGLLCIVGRCQDAGGDRGGAAAGQFRVVSGGGATTAQRWISADADRRGTGAEAARRTDRRCEERHRVRLSDHSAVDDALGRSVGQLCARDADSRPPADRTRLHTGQ